MKLLTAQDRARLLANGALRHQADEEPREYWSTRVEISGSNPDEIALELALFVHHLSAVETLISEQGLHSGTVAAGMNLNLLSDGSLEVSWQDGQGSADPWPWCRARKPCRYLGDGLGAKEFVRELNVEGHRTRRGGPWRAGAVHRVLTNRAYLGRVVWRGQDRAGTHEPLVGENLFESVQQKLRARRQTPPRRLASENLLVGLTRCARCGASMFIQRPGNAPKRHYRYYACAHRVESRSCDQPYIPADRLEGTVISKLQELSTRPDLIRPFLAREIKRRKAASRERERCARALERRLADLEARQGRLVDWLAETLPGKTAARKLNEKIERLEEEKKKLAQELAEIGRSADEDLDGVTSEAVARHLAEFGYYLDQFNAGQRKELLETVVQAVIVEGPASARLRLDLPIRPQGKLDRLGSK